MKRKIMAAVIAAAMAVSFTVPAVPIRAAEVQETETEDSGSGILAMTSDANGVCVLVGARAFNGNLFLLLGYKNNSNRNNYPLTAFKVNAFQDGIALQMAITLDKPEGFENSATLVQPGAALPFFEAFALRNESPVEVQLSPLIDFTGSNTVSYVFSYEELTGEPVQDKSSDAVNWEEKYNELLDKYQDLEEKYIALLESITG